MITKLKLKMFAMPRAKHSTIQTTPVLENVSILCDLKYHELHGVCAYHCP
jgi:hypothetical protein